MIRNIKKISSIGIYDNYENKGNLNDFARFNLFYGWNGSGKSTLSRLFRILENKRIPEDCKKIKFRIEMYDNKIIDEKNIHLYSDKIHVFNDDFIKENIEWDGKIESILLMSQEKITEMAEYKKLKQEIYGDLHHVGLLSKKENMIDKIEKSKKEVGDILSSGAKNIKDKLRFIEPSDTYYSNYNKTRAESFIKKNEDVFIDGSGILKEAEVEKQAKKASPIKKARINEILDEISIEYFLKIENCIVEILNTIISAKVIEELKENHELSEWVKTGLKIHNGDKRNVCAFCGSNLSINRTSELENHYNKAFQEFKNNLSITKQKIIKNYIDIDKIKQDNYLFYPELCSEIEVLNEKLIQSSKFINQIITTWDNYLDEKDNKPFYLVEYKNQNIEDNISDFNSIIKEIKGVIKIHNKKTEEFELITNGAKKKLELHYMNEHLLDLHYFDKCIDIIKQEKAYSDLSTILLEKEQRYLDLEAILSNETLGAEEFNNKLEAFLGHGELKLTFDRELKGYKIIRHDKTEAKHLSEGEKTSIAFLYFITKLHENEEDIKNQIIVIDDPISSFDSNKIFHAYAFLKTECDNAKQLFVLTHNYNYYSMILSWFCKKKKKDSKNEKNLPDYSLYKIEAVLEDGKRKSVINNSGSGMTQSSEYDYLFYSVYRMKENILCKEDLIYCGNVARKLVESFLSFKFPSQRGDLASLLEAAFKGEGKEGQITKEKIYKFINVYSHHKQIDVFGQLDTDILESNFENIICDILYMIKKLDENHYNAMVNKAIEEMKNQSENEVSTVASF